MAENPIKVTDIQQLPAFGRLSEAQMQSLTSVMVRRVYVPGQFIFLEGDPSAGIWFVLRGHVKIIKHSHSGRLQGLCLINSGKCFGSCPLFDDETNPADAQALDDVTLAILPQVALQRLVHKDRDLATCLLRMYTERLSHLARLGECLGSWPVGARINDCLIAYSDQVEQQPTVRLTHEQLAELVGTAREVVTRHLTQLEDNNIVRVKPGEIVLIDPGALTNPCPSHQP
jgi:CRP/FNR family transcriptional regulator, cyclic AMP receptor protein